MGGIFGFDETEASLPKGAGLPKGVSQDFLARCDFSCVLAHAGARHLSVFLLVLLSRLHSHLHGPLTIAHCNPSYATIGCTLVFAGVGFSRAQNIADYKPSIPFTQSRYVAASFTAH